MLFFLILSEAGIRLLWNPHIIGQRLYTRFDNTYSYGFDIEKTLWFEKNNNIYFYPTQYINFHQQSLPAFKKNNELRIFTFGGSVSRATATANYSYYLQENLNLSDPNHHWSVINLSADGFGSKRMLLLLKTIFPLKPDLVILHVHGSNEYEDERDDAYSKELHTGLNGIILQSHLLVLLKKTYAYLSATGSPAVSDAENEMIASQSPSNQQRWLNSIDYHLSQMLRLCKQSDIPVILVGRAEKLEGMHGYLSKRADQINKVLKKYTGPNTTYFSTADQFLEAHPKAHGKDLLFSDETHWTERAHRQIAEKLQIHLHRLTSLVSLNAISAFER